MSSIDTMNDFSDSEQQESPRNSAQKSKNGSSQSQNSKLPNDVVRKVNYYEKNPNELRVEQVKYTEVNKQVCKPGNSESNLPYHKNISFQNWNKTAKAHTLPNNATRALRNSSEAPRQQYKPIRGDNFEKHSANKEAYLQQSAPNGGRSKTQLKRFPGRTNPVDSQETPKPKASYLPAKSKKNAMQQTDYQLNNHSNTLQGVTEPVQRIIPLQRTDYNSGTPEVPRQGFRAAEKKTVTIDNTSLTNPRRPPTTKTREVTDDADVFMNPLFIDDCRQNTRPLPKKRMLTRYNVPNFDPNAYSTTYGTYHNLPPHAQITGRHLFTPNKHYVW